MCLKWIRCTSLAPRIHTTKRTFIRFKYASSWANEQPKSILWLFWQHDNSNRIEMPKQNVSYFLLVCSFFFYHICKCWNHRLKTQLHFIRNHNNNRNGLLWFFYVSFFANICNDGVIHGHEPFEKGFFMRVIHSAVICHPEFSPSCDGSRLVSIVFREGCENKWNKSISYNGASLLALIYWILRFFPLFFRRCLRNGDKM